MHNAMKCGYDGGPKRGRIVQGNDIICSEYVRSTRVDDNMFQIKLHARTRRPRTAGCFVMRVSKENPHHDFPNKAIKLRRLPIFFTFSVLILR